MASMKVKAILTASLLLAVVSASPPKLEANESHLLLRDEAGNIYSSIPVSERSDYTITYTGEGAEIAGNMPAAKKSQLGTMFYISNQAPTIENKFFVRME